MTATFRIVCGTLMCRSYYRGKRIDESALEEFWEQNGFAKRRGVYVFGVKAAKGVKPLYVGQTKRQTFKTRIDQHIKGGKFNSMLRSTKKATVLLFLVGRVGQGKRSNGSINELELDLINHAFARNPSLHNERGIKRPKYRIHGLGPGKPSRTTSQFRQMVGV